MLSVLRFVRRATPERFARLVMRELVRDGVRQGTMKYDAVEFAVQVDGEPRIPLHNAYLAYQAAWPWHRQAAIASVLAARRFARQIVGLAARGESEGGSRSR
jgi:hypothetical protein